MDKPKCSTCYFKGHREVASWYCNFWKAEPLSCYNHRPRFVSTELRPDTGPVFRSFDDQTPYSPPSYWNPPADPDPAPTYDNDSSCGGDFGGGGSSGDW